MRWNLGENSVQKDNIQSFSYGLQVMFNLIDIEALRHIRDFQGEPSNRYT